MLRLNVLPLIVLLGLVTPAATFAAEGDAAPISEANGHLVLEALGHQLALPMPDWVDPAWRERDGLSALIDTNYVTLDGQAAVSLYPKGEGEGFWTKRYGARILDDASTALVDYRDAAIDAFATTCKPGLTGFFQLEPDGADHLPPLGFVCGGFLDALPGYRGKGEVMVMGFLKSPNGLGVVFQEWQGTAFDPADPTSWPVDVQTVEARVAQFKTDASLAVVD
ncbi:hypothetical protein DEVEQU_00256 [Devosia equisanguinis]|uniref:Uncharacterized protein n=1 Tax=Devosia equisanguinis TaxID=2490941 RepID=A0A447I6M2_9HYPH|nr:hypothetical protein [uncultured Devosia sp.]ODU85372.1 MAG: hypothetical protein ABT14_12980 [Pelagibacterium sp. SCN 63-17]VDS03136.1 hypothetical protein DEVEQU_00256 [Devosia equisanguinis]